MSEILSPGLSLTDETFDPGVTGNYELALFLGGSGISLCLLDVKHNKFTVLLEYLTSGNDGREADRDLPVVFEAVVRAVPWLKGSFRQVRTAYEGMKGLLVPAALFDPEEKEKVFGFSYQIAEGEEVMYDHLQSLDAFYVYTIPRALLRENGMRFPGTRIVHASSVLIESIRLNYKNRINAPRVFLHIRSGAFDLMIFDGRQLSYFNTFPFHNPEDVTYYLIFVMEQLDLNPEEVPVVMLGNTARTPGMEDLLYRYVRHVEHGRRNDAFRYSYALNQLPHEAFFPLFNFLSCGL